MSMVLDVRATKAAREKQGCAIEALNQAWRLVAVALDARGWNGGRAPSLTRANTSHEQRRRRRKLAHESRRRNRA